MTIFFVGMKFESFKLLRNKIIEYKNTQFCNSKIQNSKKLTAITNKINKNINYNIVYYKIKYVCFFGPLYKNRSKEKRNGNTYKNNCHFYLVFRASVDGKCLELKKFNNDHNHQCTNNLFENLPDQKKIDLQNKSNISKLISLNASLKLIQSKFQKKTRKNILLKSLHNIKTKFKPQIDIENIVNNLTNLYNCDVKILKSDENEVCGLFFVDKQMKKNLEFSLEIMLMNGTYKLLDSRSVFKFFLSKILN